MSDVALHRVVNLVRDEDQSVLNMPLEEARRRLFSDDPGALEGVRGSFALVARRGERVRLARSLDRPLRFFLAKEEDGPMLVVAERIDGIRQVLEDEGYGAQFHPTYTRMVPAHHVTEIHLVGCPDPKPDHLRFFDPPRGALPADPDAIGAAYVEALCAELRLWLRQLSPAEPIGVLFSGGLDSGALLLCLYHEILRGDLNPARLKAFTLAVDGGGPDADQAREFLARAELQLLGEEIEVSRQDVSPLRAVEVIEDYKPLDVECAAVNLALMEGIRQRYPSWRVLVDGDGGDENLKDYPIEENEELTIRSVVNNRMLYHEGWGVDALKHSETYSGGLSRGCVRGYAPARHLGFDLFSPYTSPRVVGVSEAIPFDELAGGSREALYRLKGEVLTRGVRQVTGRELPAHAKRRFQEGAMPSEAFAERFGVRDAERYRSHYLSLHRER